MVHLKVIGIKFMAITVVVLSTFGIINATSIPTLLLISLITTAVTFLIGDVLILRATGNLIATMADFGLVLVVLWLFGSSFIGGDYPIVGLSLAASFFIALIEPFVHQILLEQTGKSDVPFSSDLDGSLQTEFSEEMTPQERSDIQNKTSDHQDENS